LTTFPFLTWTLVVHRTWQNWQQLFTSESKVLTVPAPAEGKAPRPSFKGTPSPAAVSAPILRKPLRLTARGSNVLFLFLSGLFFFRINSGLG
jgi:hypothetical protein